MSKVLLRLLEDEETADRDHATHALKNSPLDCFLRLAPPGFQVLVGSFIKKRPLFGEGARTAKPYFVFEQPAALRLAAGLAVS